MMKHTDAPPVTGSGRAKGRSGRVSEPGQLWHGWGLIALVMMLAVPGIYLRLSGAGFGTILDTAVYGLAIVAAAFLLSWSSEAA